jgi:DNA polymerase III subunit chi
MRKVGRLQVFFYIKMTEIKFFFNAPNKITTACKLAKRAYDDGKKLVLYAPDADIAAALDRALWTTSATSFLPHVFADSPHAAATPILIATENSPDATFAHMEALLSLSDEPPPFFSRFDFLREVVSMDDDDRAKARERLKFYKSRGFEINTLDLLNNAK